MIDENMIKGATITGFAFNPATKCARLLAYNSLSVLDLIFDAHSIVVDLDGHLTITSYSYKENEELVLHGRNGFIQLKLYTKVDA